MRMMRSKLWLAMLSHCTYLSFFAARCPLLVVEKAAGFRDSCLTLQVCCVARKTVSSLLLIVFRYDVASRMNTRNWLGCCP